MKKMTINKNNLVLGIAVCLFGSLILNALEAPSELLIVFGIGVGFILPVVEVKNEG